MISFTEKECNKIINLSNVLEENTRDGKNASVDRPHENISYSFYNIERNETTQWIFDRLWEFLDKEEDIKVVNQLDILHMHQYKVGNQFLKHRDVYYENQAWNVGICLNDDYEGGDFIIYEPEVTLPKKTGSIYSFKNTRLHEVTKITKGERWSIIGFLHNENIDLKKLLL